MSRTLVLRPCAKINLTLRVGPRRPDGYHDVRTLLQSIAMSDRLTLTARSGPFVVATRGAGVPADRTNLVWRAGEALWRAIGRSGDPSGVHVKLDKQIPVAAGLGGGSADAAAALAGLNEMWGARRATSELARIGAALGADVPFFLRGGTAVGVGRGDELYPVDDIRPLSLVVIKPSIGVSTADAYGWCDEDRARGEEAAPVASRRDVDVGWAWGAVTLTNDLEAPVARRHPVIAEMIQACVREGAVAAAMTGSGSAVFGVFADAVVRKAQRRLQRPDWLVALTRTCSRGEAARHLGLGTGRL
ncbi:MAG: 4-(cytidine 5'-diphospho)-2-C-methyl-D-erythritol kinase [Acidobacteria bacterium]|nr:4-(cytidine 5'-diphospho)-2-C-methyl-D-erythritol kinase [Acidobacteriota bacterium]